jgi:hypothetical protein
VTGNRHQKYVINMDHDGDRHVACAWEDCEKDGLESFKAVVHNGTPGYPQDVSHVFCSQRHKEFWVTSSIRYGRLPEGRRSSYL